MSLKNPYNWQSTQLEVAVKTHPQVDTLAEQLLEGSGVLVLGGRGMGKSVFLEHLRAWLADVEDLAVVLIAGPPPRLDVEACLGQLARALGVGGSQQDYFDTREIIDAYFVRRDVPARLVLLFDEFDRYAKKGDGQSSHPPGRSFFNDLEITRRNRTGLGILAAGSIGVFAFRDSLGSSFLSRARHVNLAPFDRASISELATPFAQRDRALDQGVLEALHLASGGIPALLVYGLQELWKLPREIAPRDVTEAYVRFHEEHFGYLDDVQKAFADPALSQAPQRVLDLFRQSSGSLPRTVLEEVCESAKGPLGLSLRDVLLALSASGLLRMESSPFAGDPVRAHVIPSLLNLPTEAPKAAGLEERLRRDLTLLLGKLHGASVDFFRPGTPKGTGKVAGDKQLVPESVFAAHLALGFELLGWRAEREAQSAAGRTDIKLRYNGGDEVAVIEVKIWGRQGSKQAQQQVEGYWTAGVKAGAVVQITDAELRDWPQAYGREVLDGLGRDAGWKALSVEGSALRACFAVPAQVSQGARGEIVHFLLQLSRR